MAVCAQVEQLNSQLEYSKQERARLERALAGHEAAQEAAPTAAPPGAAPEADAATSAGVAASLTQVLCLALFT